MMSGKAHPFLFDRVRRRDAALRTQFWAHGFLAISALRVATGPQFFGNFVPGAR